MPKQIRKPKKTNLEERVTELYQEPDGSLPDMKHIERKNSNAGFFVVFIVCLFLGAAAGAAWLGYFMFNPSRGTFSEEQIVVNVSVPEHIGAGGEKDYTVRIQNTSAREIAAAEVNLRGPQGFVVTTADPTAVTPKNERWTVGAIPSNGEKNIRLKGVYVGATGASGVLRAQVSYRPSNFNANFEKVTDTALAIEKNPVTLSVQTAAQEKNTSHTITYANTGADMIGQSELVAELGSDVAITKTTPTAKISGSTVTLAISEIKPASTQTLVIVTAPKTGVSPTPFPAPRAISLARIIGEHSLLLAQTTIGSSAATSTTAGGHSLALSTNIQHPDALKPGELVPFTLQFTNNSTAPIKNAKIVVSADAPSVNNKSVFDFSNLQTPGDPDVIGKQLSATRRSGTITWIAKDAPELAEIAPGGRVTILFTMRVKNATEFTPFPALGNATFAASLKADGVSDTATPLQFTFAAAE